MLCEVCLSIKRAAEFANDMWQSWRDRDLSRDSVCTRCTGEEAKQGRRAVDPRLPIPEVPNVRHETRGASELRSFGA